MKLNSPESFHSGLIMLLIIIVIIFFIYAKLRVDYNKGVEYSDKAIELISLNICPICAKNRVGPYRIKVGYVIDKSNIPHKILRIGDSRKSDEITGSVPLCENCKEEFLAFRISDPSKTVLVRKRGCHRGLFNPYDKKNVFIEV